MTADKKLAELAAVAKSSLDTTVTDLEPETAIRLLHSLRTSITTLGVLDAALVRHIYLTGKHGDVDIEGIGRVSVRRGQERKAWDHQGLAEAIVHANMSLTGGEIPDPWVVRDWFMDAAGISYWKVTALRNVGVDPDDYCQSAPGKPSVQLPKIEVIP